MELASFVLFEERADWSEVKYPVMALAPLVEVEESVLLDEPGELDNSVDTTFSASEVSPDCKSLLTLDMAWVSGSCPEEDPDGAPFAPMPGGGYWER